MKVGTADVSEITETEFHNKRPFGSSLGNGGGGGNRGGGSGGGSDDGDAGTAEDPVDISYSHRYRILTMFLLLVVLMTFGGLVAAYVVIQTNKAAEWQPFPVPFQIWISTVLIALSSAAYVLFEKRLQTGDQTDALKWLKVTAALGSMFIASQLVLWLEMVNRGYYMRGNPYAGFFYILTAVHAVHVTGGMAALGSLLFRSWKRNASEGEIERRTAQAHVVGWYWHFMGMLWVVLLFLLAYWK